MAIDQGHDQTRDRDLSGRLHALARTLAPDGAERSFKLTAGALSAERFLYGVRKDRLPLPALLALGQRLGMPDVYRPILQQRYPEANFFYLGFERDVAGCCYKLYCEFPVFIGIPPGTDGQGGRPALMFLGLKWDAVGGVPVAVTHYVWRVHLPLAGIRACLAATGAAGGAVAAAAAEDILMRCGGRVPDRKLVLLQVAEPRETRCSFDLNLYAAGATVGMAADLVRTAAAHYGVDPVPVDRLLTRIAERPLGHVAGGIDRRGRDFLTVYYEVPETAAWDGDTG